MYRCGANCFDCTAIMQKQRGWACRFKELYYSKEELEQKRREQILGGQTAMSLKSIVALLPKSKLLVIVNNGDGNVKISVETGKKIRKATFVKVCQIVRRFNGWYLADGKNSCWYIPAINLP